MKSKEKIKMEWQIGNQAQTRMKKPSPAKSTSTLFLTLVAVSFVYQIILAIKLNVHYLLCQNELIKLVFISLTK